MNSGVDPTVTGREGMFWRIWEQVRQRKATLASLGAMTGSQMLVAVLGLIAGIVQARFVKPEVLGYYAAFAILGGYLTFLHLGSLTALQRDYPYWLGRGEPERATQTAALVQGWVLIISVGSFILYSALVIGSLFAGNLKATAGWGSQLVVVSLSNYVLYLGCTYRSTSEFIRYSRITVFSTLVSVACLPLVVFFQFWGLCVRGAIPALAGMVMLHRTRPLHVSPRFDWESLWKLIKFGLPVDLAGYLATSGTSATMGAVLTSHYGVRVLGLFALARMIEAVVQQLSLSITQVFVPRINQQMGKTENLRHCATYALKATAIGTLVVTVLVGVGVLVCGPLIAWQTPKYIDSIPILRVLVWAGIAPLLSLPAHAWLAARRTQPVIISNIAGPCTFFAVCGLALLANLPPMVIAWGYVGGKFVAVAVLWIYLTKGQWRAAAAAWQSKKQ